MDINNIITNYTEFAQKEITQSSLLEFLLTWTQFKEQCEEYYAQTYIAYTCDTQNNEKSNAYTEAIQKMELLTPITHQIELKVTQFFKNYPENLNYAMQLIKNDIALYSEKNIPLETKENQLSQDYQAIIGSFSIEHDGKRIPLSMARPLLEQPDRELRKNIFEKIHQEYYNAAEKINTIFDQQVSIRHNIAQNVNKDNFRDYMHKAKARLDYTPKDCMEFSQSILETIVPIAQSIHKQKASDMRLATLTPFDTAADSFGRPALTPATSPEEFLEKSILVLDKVDNEVSSTLKTLNNNKTLDLFSRMGKAPGGYNYPLSLSKTSFIFMNSSLTHQDMVTLFHETGHAYHFDLYKNQQEPFLYKSPSSEIAELASMSMELMSMEHWDILYPQEEDLKRAKKQQLEGIIHFFPWMAIVDSFQQWVYTYPHKTIQERNEYFVQLYKKYIPGISWTGYEQYLNTLWHKQLHIIEVPFYYIEYGIAQLGALQIWKMYKENPQNALEKYKTALRIASKVPMSEAYEEAGIPISFSSKHIASLMEFVKQELFKI